MSVYLNSASTLQYEDFTYSRVIRDLTSEEFYDARDIVVAMWSGALQLWEGCDEDTKFRKRSAVLNLLVAWYLCDMYPTRVMGGIQSSGGLGISHKQIRDVSITYRSLNLPEAYDNLATNQFGVKAATMLRYSPEMMGVYG